MTVPGEFVSATRQFTVTQHWRVEFMASSRI